MSRAATLLVAATAQTSLAVPRAATLLVAATAQTSLAVARAATSSGS
jgi:hypothetical protein